MMFHGEPSFCFSNTPPPLIYKDEYATAVWDPYLSKDILELESVQCFAPKVGIILIVTCCLP